MKVAYAGAPGAHGEAAALTVEGGEPVPYPSFAEVLRAVEAGEVELGVLPLHNSRAGMVEEVVRLLAKAPVQVADRVALRIHQCLLALPGSRLDQIEHVTSHPHALAQCGQFLGRRDWKLVPAENTAIAARRLSQERTPGTAVVASRRSAELYGLAVLAHDIEDDGENTTRFAVVRRAPGTGPR
jgi:prephenate dehydratase